MQSAEAPIARTALAATWVDDALSEILRLRGADGWGYRPRTEPYVEPTVLCSLALLAHRDTGPTRQQLAQSANWLSAIQQNNGAVGLSESLTYPHWPTPLALLLWTALGTHAEERRRATEWLLATKGEAIRRGPGDPIGHDTTIVGWPWVEHTHSWVEPTSMAILALRRQDLGRHSRVRDGLRLLRDRAIATGGWNYGNNVVFETTLRPRPAPTGLALLAQAGIAPKSDAIVRAIDYLLRALPSVRSGQSLGWGLLGLSAWGKRPAEADAWLEQAYAEARTRADLAPQLAYLLLASPRALSLFGITEVRS